MPHPNCPFCDRLCDRCGYLVPGGWDHKEQPQPPESNVVVCSLIRHVDPLGQVVGDYLSHRNDGHLMTESEMRSRRGF